MPVADNNPERRNLVVTALCFIVFVLAEGQVNDAGVRLQVVNVTFNKPEVLAVLAWVMLGWFYLRYWQINRGMLRKDFVREIMMLGESKAAIWYAKAITGKSNKAPDGIVVMNLIAMDKRLAVKIGDVIGGNLGRRGEWTNYTIANARPLAIRGWRAPVMLFLLIFETAIKEPSVGSYYLPHVLFYFAVTAGMDRLMT